MILLTQYFLEDFYVSTAFQNVLEHKTRIFFYLGQTYTIAFNLGFKYYLA